jgi:hypothetical protein
MERAIEVLKNEVSKCNYMTKFFEQELINQQHETADQTKVEKLKRELKETADIKQECLDAIDYLKNVKY